MAVLGLVCPAPERGNSSVDGTTGEELFAGILCLDDANSPADLLGPADLLRALFPDHPPGAVGSYRDGPFFLQAGTANPDPARAGGQGQTGGALPYRCPESGQVISIWGRLDNRAALAAELDWPPAAADRALVLAAFRRWGPCCARKMSGDFSAVIYDPGARRVVLLRDPLGVKPLYYRVDAGTLVFAASAAVFPLLRRPVTVPDQDWIARMLAGNCCDTDPTATGWVGVLKLAPGHWLDVRPGGRRLERYHFWSDDPPWTTRRSPERVTAYGRVLAEAVRCRMRDADLIGSESSGGIDSATVTAYLARFLGDPADRLHAFGFACLEKEPEYILETSRHAGIRHNYVWTAPRELTDIDISRGLAAVGYPEQQASAIIHIPFYEECRRRGIRTLFSGFGGDEGVTNQGNLLGRELLDHRAYLALWRLMPGNPLTRVLRAARAAAVGARWGAGNPSLQVAMDARWPHQLLREDVAKRLGLRSQYMLAAAFDAPYRRVNDFVLGNRLGPWVARRLETCTLIAATYGVEYRWPLLDARLIQQFLSTPSIEKADRRAGRYLHRRAIEGVVPPKVAWMRKDMGAPAGSPALDGMVAPTLVREARRQRAHPHPGVAELIDLERFDSQIAAATSGQLAGEAAWQFSQNITCLRWLNHWLSGGPPPA